MPGATELTVTPYSATFAAATFVRLMTAALLARVGGRGSPRPELPATDEM